MATTDVLDVTPRPEAGVSIEVNHLCGTLELGLAVADLVLRTPDPNRAIVGRLVRNVPMG